MVKSLNNFLIVGYDEEDDFFIVTMEIFKSAKEAQYFIDEFEDSQANERWFVVQALNTDNV